MPEVHTGSCECGAVKYQLRGRLQPVVACHCTQCRKTSGHFWAGTLVRTDALSITEDRGLAWYQSSAHAQRGFCQRCGASLFWQAAGEGTTSVGAGTLDGDSGLHTSKHIFVDDKGDYYDILHGNQTRD
ncbi:aldehyde-activating protein [Amylibacter marinus]|uniref:Aldehyde-activating protein n=1 Tax=Amylibacter marinus TaxID=1475483 RepID=A0ABQ5VX81_9RHOB|nr:GFA family protein [Amylibacter marinus]GLQ35698.1 aldehyde-activating protein [Amylibacter marinus]